MQLQLRAPVAETARLLNRENRLQGSLTAAATRKVKPISEETKIAKKIITTNRVNAKCWRVGVCDGGGQWSNAAVELNVWLVAATCRAIVPCTCARALTRVLPQRVLYVANNRTLVRMCVRVYLLLIARCFHSGSVRSLVCRATLSCFFHILFLRSFYCGRSVQSLNNSQRRELEVVDGKRKKQQQQQPMTAVKKSKKQKTKTICRVGDSSGNDKSGKNKLETHTSTKIAKSEINK